MTKKTTKKLKVVGTETYINSSTGKSLEMNVVQVQDGDANFQKIWISQILAVVDELSSKKLKFVMYLIKKSSENNNVIPLTVAELAKAAGVGRTTVLETLRALARADVIKRKRGSIFINPSFVFKGSHQGRMNVLFKYESMDQSTTDEERLRQAKEEMTLLNAKKERLSQKIADLAGEGFKETTQDEPEFDPMDPTTHPPAPY